MVTTREARLLSNPLRVQIFGAITTGAITTTELAKRLNATLATVSYHAAVLCNAGYVHRVDDRGDSGADLLYKAD